MPVRPSETKLTDLKDTLEIEYVRRILQQAEECDRTLGDAEIRVCLNGDIDPPHYSIDAVMDPETGQTTAWGMFHGKTHKHLSDKIADKMSWAQEWMTLREVSALIGEMRNFSKKSEAKTK